MHSVLVRRLIEQDVPKVAEIHAEAFSRQGQSTEWIRCNVRAFPRMRYHFAWTKEEAVVQLNGTGPWGVTYVNPADDPRKK
jgi:hypothetical protein